MGFSSLGPEASAPRETTPFRVRPIDPDDQADTRTAARLHIKLFGEIGPIAQLGEHLIASYCYGHLIRTGMMKAVLFDVGDQSVGLAAYTGDVVALHEAALRRHLPFVLRETLRSLIRQPRLLARLPGVAMLIWERHSERMPSSGPPFAEVVTFGVLPRYRTHKFVQRSGLHVPDLLLDHVLDDLRTLGYPRVRGVVLTSNKPAVAFFCRRADRVESFPTALRPSIQVWLTLLPNQTSSVDSRG